MARQGSVSVFLKPFLPLDSSKAQGLGLMIAKDLLNALRCEALLDSTSLDEGVFSFIKWVTSITSGSSGLHV